MSENRETYLCSENVNHNAKTIHSESNSTPLIRNYDANFLLKLLGMCFIETNIVVYYLQYRLKYINR
jgi:hypothetical protein